MNQIKRFCSTTLRQWGVIGQKPFDEQTKQILEKVFRAKAILATVISIVSACLNLIFANIFRKTEEYMQENPDNKINIECVEKYVTTLEYTVTATWALFAIFTCLSFKWRNLHQFYFAWWILVNCQEAFLPYANHGVMVFVRYSYLQFSFLGLSGTETKMNIFIAFLYIGTQLYAQTVVTMDLTFKEVLFSNSPQIINFVFTVYAYRMIYWGLGNVVKERNLFKFGHLNFVHNLKEGMVIVKGNFASIKLINVAARKLLKLPFDDAQDNPEFFKKLSLCPIELGVKSSRGTRETEVVQRSDARMTFVQVVTESLRGDCEDRKKQIYEVKPPSALASQRDGQNSRDEENLELNLHEQQQSLFVNIEAQTMEYFEEEVTVVFMRDVSKEVTNFSLKRKDEKNKAKLKAMRYSNENVAHEMRTPLNSIIILINLLLAFGCSVREHRKAHKYYNQIKFQAQLLLHFVNDLLDYRLIKNEKFETNLVKFNPNTAFGDIISMFKEQARSQGIKLILKVKYFLQAPASQSEPRSQRLVSELFKIIDSDMVPNLGSFQLPILFGDQVRLQQVLINLIKNALKFTTQGFIKVTAAFNPIEKILTVHVRDTGIGIERSNLGKLFKRFSKLRQEDSSVNQEGRGLGLAICDAIVAKNDGLIEVQSEGLGKGTLFLFSMKIEPFDEEVDSVALDSDQSRSQDQESEAENTVMMQHDNSFIPLQNEHSRARQQQDAAPSNEVSQVAIEVTVQSENQQRRIVTFAEPQIQSQEHPQVNVIRSDLSQERGGQRSQSAFELSDSSESGEEDAAFGGRSPRGDPEVLIVDDQIFNIFAMQEQIDSLGVASDKAESGEKAVCIFTQKLNKVVLGEETMYKIIFLDYSMQDGMNGPETAMQLRQLQQSYEADHPTTSFTRPYICCLSAYSGKQFQDQALSYGMDKYYIKPIYLTALDDLLTRRNVTRSEKQLGQY